MLVWTALVVTYLAAGEAAHGNDHDGRLPRCSGRRKESLNAIARRGLAREENPPPRWLKKKTRFKKNATNLPKE